MVVYTRFKTTYGEDKLKGGNLMKMKTKHVPQDQTVRFTRRYVTFLIIIALKILCETG